MSTLDFFPRFRACFDDDRLPPNARLLLLALLRKANNETLLATPSAALLVKLTGLPRSTVYEQRAVLVRLGYLTIRERRDDDRGQLSSEYTLHFSTGYPHHATMETLARESPDPNAGTRGTATQAPTNHTTTTHHAQPPPTTPSGDRTPPSTPRTGLSVPADTHPVRGPDGTPSGDRTHSATSPTAPAILRESTRAHWDVFYAEYEAIRTHVYGDCGATSQVPNAQKDAILLGASHVVARTGVDAATAARTIVDVWVKTYPGTNNVLTTRNHPLRYLAGDISEVSVAAVKALLPKPKRPTTPRAPEPPTMTRAETIAAATAAAKNLG